MIQDSVRQLGPLNMMVANAGIAQVRPLLELTEDDWERMFRVNVFGVNNCYVEAAKQMVLYHPISQLIRHMRSSQPSQRARPPARLEALNEGDRRADRPTLDRARSTPEAPAGAARTQRRPRPQ